MAQAKGKVLVRKKFIGSQKNSIQNCCSADSEQPPMLVTEKTISPDLFQTFDSGDSEQHWCFTYLKTGFHLL